MSCSCYLQLLLFSKIRRKYVKIELEKIYELLKGIGAVQSEAEFSKKWWGKSECYWRSLRFKKATASVGAVAVCASKLQHVGMSMRNTKLNADLGHKFLELSKQCHNYINRKVKTESIT